MRLCCSVAALLLCVSAPLDAQAVPPDSGALRTLALVQPTLRELSARRVASDSTTGEPAVPPSVLEVLGRAGLGTLGAGLGALGGGLVGYALLPHSDCKCDDPGLREFVLGAAIGTVAGAAFAAAVPKQRSRCSFSRRAAYGILGAVAGGALGLAAPREGQRLVLLPFGAATGAGILSAFC